MKRALLTKYAQVVIPTLLLIFIITISSRAQINNTIQSNSSLAEKIYLQLDSKVYTTGNTVWFKCIVTNAMDHNPTLLSGVVYIELITPDEKIIDKKIIKIENGIGHGSFQLNKNLNEGNFQIRAFTQWNKNFNTDQIFKEYIQVFASKATNLTPINNVKLYKNQNDAFHLEASINPMSIDSLHKNKLKVYIIIDNKKDSVLLKKGSDNTYKMDYTLAQKSRLATIQLKTDNKKMFSKTILLDVDFIDLQFFPESGVMLHGLPSKIGFKCLDANGKGKAVQGAIIDEKDTVIATFTANALGMGSFTLNNVDSTKTYYARIASQSEKNLLNLYPLPRVSPKGNILSITKQDEQILLTAMSDYIKNDSVYLQIFHRGMNLYLLKVNFENGIFNLSIPTENLPDGIVAFRMLNNQKQTVAERLYFNQKPENRLQIALTTDKNVYAKRELTKLDIKTTNFKGDPIKANLSVLVINDAQMGTMQNLRQNILSYFLLDSELKGEIENPGFYFKNDSCSHSNIDALMLTQGWRKYLYSMPLTKISIAPEQALTVSGQVKTVITNKPAKNVELNMITYGKSNSFYNEKTDSLGRFSFGLNDEFDNSINMLIQTSKKTGQKKDYNISIDKKESPVISFEQEKSIVKLDSVVSGFIAKNIERNKIDEKFRTNDESILLKEVIVKGKRMTPIHKQVMEDYGESNVIIDGKEIRSKEEKWSYGLYSVLLFNYPDKVRIERNREGRLYAKVLGSDMTLVVIDGIPVMWYEYEFIPSIDPSEVISFEIIKCAKNFDELYCKVAPPSSCNLPPHIPCGSVIAIYTYGKKGISGTQAPVGLTQTTIPVFSTPIEFYAPKYDNMNSGYWNKPDLRALIHWEPVLKTDSTGILHSTFYNADNVGKMKVVVEAISENGEIGYQEMEFKVAEK